MRPYAYESSALDLGLPQDSIVRNGAVGVCPN